MESARDCGIELKRPPTDGVDGPLTASSAKMVVVKDHQQGDQLRLSDLSFCSAALSSRSVGPREISDREIIVTGSSYSDSGVIDSTYSRCSDTGVLRPSNKTRTLQLRRLLPTIAPSLPARRGLRVEPSKLTLQRAPMIKVGEDLSRRTKATSMLGSSISGLLETFLDRSFIG
jgi:hypothetical protein